MNSLWGGVEQPSQRTPGGGCQHPPNGGSSEMHDWGGVHKITGVHGPLQGCVENTLRTRLLKTNNNKLTNGYASIRINKNGYTTQKLINNKQQMTNGYTLTSWIINDYTTQNCIQNWTI